MKKNTDIIFILPEVAFLNRYIFPLFSGARNDVKIQDNIEDDSDTDGSISEPVSEDLMLKKKVNQNL